MNKKKTANIIMAAIIAVIAISGILYAGCIKGWFDKNKTDTAVLADYRGLITLERNGAAFIAGDATSLRKGDKIVCDTGSAVRITVGSGYITLGQGAEAEVEEPGFAGFTLEISGGEAFVNAYSPVCIKFAGKQVEIKDAVAGLSVRAGAQSISVYDGAVGEAEAGQMLEWIGMEQSVRDLSILSLNEFNIGQLRQAGSSRNVIFSNAELEQLEADRWAQQHNQAEDSQPDEFEMSAGTGAQQEEVPSDPEIMPQEQETAPPKQEETPRQQADIEQSDITQPDIEQSDITQPDITQAETAKPSEAVRNEEKEEKLTCTITIRCDTILDNWDRLEPGKAGYVPENGCILPKIQVEFKKGDTVFDILKKVCRQYDIPIEYSWTPVFDSYYVEGINNLYEFDCGFESGWMYRVNGWFPNYGCSSYKLSGGEFIVFDYTCNGLGEDVGAGNMLK